MTEPDFGDIRVRHRLREEALQSLTVACSTACISGLIGAALIGYIAWDVRDWSMGVLGVAGGALSAWLGWWTYSRQSRAAAWALGVLAAGNLVVRVVITESLGGSLVGILICVAYYRAWRGTEMLFEIREHDHAQQGAA